MAQVHTPSRAVRAARLCFYDLPTARADKVEVFYCQPLAELPSYSVEVLSSKITRAESILRNGMGTLLLEWFLHHRCIQISQEAKAAFLSSYAVGGLYWRHTLRHIFLVNADKSFIPGLGPFEWPRVWCGAPTAALRRTFQIIGNSTAEGIPEPQLEQLWQLRQLYARKVTSRNLHESARGVRSANQIEGMQNDSQTPGNTPVTTASVHTD